MTNLGILLPGKTSEVTKGGWTTVKSEGMVRVCKQLPSLMPALNVAATREQPTRKHRGPQWLNVNGLKPQKQTQSETTADQVKPKGPSELVQTQTSWKLERCHKPTTEQTSAVNGHPDVSSSFLPQK